ncbi:MAG: Gldg family protein [Thermoguttaceae bacterium]|nr:Gldg family protein [Thermoguttaceae bacterium]
MPAVFKRDFVSYFLNPTGYVFICVFVLLSSAAAFLPDDFINSNLANLSQLNIWFPFISLIFIPAVTMGIWAEERRNGTAELLLTSPLSTVQTVLGKYAAAVGVYTASLLFSFLANWIILAWLGRPDFGLFVSTYLGYELIGLVMLALGMLGSFLTRQLTVAYIFGVLLNVPLAVIRWADALPVSRRTASFLKAASLDAFFEPFGRGIVSLSGILYFTLIPAVILCFCVFLTDAPRWSARRPAAHLAHFVFRAAAALVLISSLVGLVRQHDLRCDMTEEKLSSLSDESVRLIDGYASDFPTVIEAYVSPEVPPEYTRIRIDLLTFLAELKNRLGSRAFVSVSSVRANTHAAYQLEKKYGVKPRRVAFETRGQLREESIFLTVVFRSGPRTVVIPFMNRGLSPEYELVSSLVNVGKREKKRLGVIKTDALLFGKTDSAGRALVPRWQLIDELARQYRVEEIDPAEPIPAGVYDALVAVQPSSLDPARLAHFTDAVARGEAAVIFEDPFPLFADYLAGTGQQKTYQPDLGIMPAPKGEIGRLWSILGVLCGTDVLWSTYNPYPKLAFFSEEFLFVDAKPVRLEAQGEMPSEPDSQTAPKGKVRVSDLIYSASPNMSSLFNPQEESVAALTHLLFPFAGYIVAERNGSSTVVPLICAEAGGSASTEEGNLIRAGVQSSVRKKNDRKGLYTLAARITGPVPEYARGEKNDARLNVILVSDLDFLTPGIFRLREEGNDLPGGARLDSDNVTFVLNAIDTAAGDEPFIRLRSRRTRHRTLSAVEESLRDIQNRASLDQIAFYKELEATRSAETDKMNRRIAELANAGGRNGKLSERETAEINSAVIAMQDRLKRDFDEKNEEYNRKVEDSRRRMNEKVRQIQGRYKLCAVLLPPIPPLLLAMAVSVRRAWVRRRDRR